MSDHDPDDGLPTMAELCDCLCPDKDEDLNCILCNRQWDQCPTCLELVADNCVDDCYQSHRTVLDDIVDAVGK